MICDICNKSLDDREGNILTTRQVVLSRGYWNRVFSTWGLVTPMKGPNSIMDQMKQNVYNFVKQMAGSQSNWWVCDECLSNIDLNPEIPRKYALEYLSTGINPSIPGSGPIISKTDILRANQVALREFESFCGL
jgi:hypothetical protein